MNRFLPPAPRRGNPPPALAGLCFAVAASCTGSPDSAAGQFDGDAPDRAARTESPQVQRRLAPARGRYTLSTPEEHRQAEEADADYAAARQREDKVLDGALQRLGSGAAGGREGADDIGLGRDIDHIVGTKPICLVSHQTPAMDSFARIAAENHADYARRHGYHNLHYRGIFGGTRFANEDAINGQSRSGLFWEKIVAIEQAMATVHPGTQAPLCDWVMWADADTLITDMNRTIETLIEPWVGDEARAAGSLCDVVLARDDTTDPVRIVQAGVMFIKNSDRGRRFVAEIFGLFPSLRRRPDRFYFGDQDALECLAMMKRPEDIVDVDGADQWAPINPDLCFAPQKTFDAYSPRWDGEDLGTYMWTKGDFLSHFAGRRTGDRVVNMRKMADDVRADALH